MISTLESHCLVCPSPTTSGMVWLQRKHQFTIQKEDNIVRWLIEWTREQSYLGSNPSSTTCLWCHVASDVLLSCFVPQLPHLSGGVTTVLITLGSHKCLQIPNCSIRVVMIGYDSFFLEAEYIVMDIFKVTQWFTARAKVSLRSPMPLPVYSALCCQREGQQFYLNSLPQPCLQLPWGVLMRETQILAH